MTELSWRHLNDYHRDRKEIRISDLFDSNPIRFEEFSLPLDDMLLDFSKTVLDDTARKLLLDLARASNLEEKRDAMFSGEAINRTEGRAALHTALRNRAKTPVYVAGTNVMPAIQTTLSRMSEFVTAISTGKICASDGTPFRDIVNIGIGGSDLGPAMATAALAPYHKDLRVHFVANVDGAQIADLLTELNPACTLFIIASKTFTTIETMTNANTAKAWIEDAVGEQSAQHFAAVSTALDKTTTFGIDPDRVFGFEDWVGGRYSVWGPIGLSLMFAIGPDAFLEFLAGAHDMDQHFRDAPIAENMPVMLGLVGIWHNNICGYACRAVLPYDQRLERLPAYLQQLDMESNGKQVTLDGSPIGRDTGPTVFGEPGTNGQHAFYQLLHQGSRIIPCEFLVAAHSHEPHLQNHHQLLLANCLAQSEALMRGRSLEDVTEILGENPASDDPAQFAHRVFPGNRPSTTLLYRKLTPRTLGRIIALYEHRVFVEGAIWGINSFDQWGVELGKELAADLLPLIERGDGFKEKNGSTRGLLKAITGLRKEETRR
ncbi:glucose-6-phosphate isomerase [Sneathiella sp.]|uniref:glucose-6-phosphate isomerase n=1 Tax=Sneathiella sp. TaxID=1964365 RepID=UPI0035680D78